MAISTGASEGSQVKLYWNAIALATKTDTLITAEIVDENEVLCVTDIGAVETGFNIIEYSKFGDNGTAKLRGKDLVGDFTFDVAFDDGQPHLASHTNLRSFTKTSALGTFIVAITTGTDAQTFVALDGYVTSVSLAPAVDGISTMSVTVSLENRPEFFING